MPGKIQNIFDEITSNATSLNKKPKSINKIKPVINLTETESETFEAFCTSDLIVKMAEGKQKASKNAIIPILKKKLLQKWIEAGKKTENPTIATEKAQANFVAKEVFGINFYEDDEGNIKNIKEALKEKGFTEEESQEISENEIKETVEVNFRNLSELRKGQPNEQKVLNKLIRLVHDNFSPNEQRILLTKINRVEVEEGFLGRCVEYSGNSLDKLELLLEVITPQWVLSHAKYSGQDLGEELSKLTGLEIPVTDESDEYFSGDKAWRATIKGLEANLYSSESGLKYTKVCNSVEHARATCKKWMRDSDYREKTLSEV